MEKGTEASKGFLTGPGIQYVIPDDVSHKDDRYLFDFEDVEVMENVQGFPTFQSTNLKYIQMHRPSTLTNGAFYVFIQYAGGLQNQLEIYECTFLSKT